MAKTTKRSDALGVAIRMEEEGIRFYTKSASQTTNQLAQRMFLSLVKDEERHRAIFQEMAENEGVRPSRVDEMAASSPMKRIGSIFKGTAASLKKAVKSTDAVIQAIDIALGMEEKAWTVYSDAAKAAKDAQERDILRRVADEENEHFRILNDTRLYLTYPQMWNIIQEKPLIDGGG